MRSAGALFPCSEIATKSFPFTPGAAIDVPESVAVASSAVFHYGKMVNEMSLNMSKHSPQKQHQRRAPTLMPVNMLTQGYRKRLTNEFRSVVGETGLVVLRVNGSDCDSPFCSRRASPLRWHIGITYHSVRKRLVTITQSPTCRDSKVDTFGNSQCYCIIDRLCRRSSKGHVHNT